MKFTFGIITDGSQHDRVRQIILSIENQEDIDYNYNIFIIGGPNVYQKHPLVQHIAFDETIKHMWITKKKNLVLNNEWQHAVHEHIVYLHDYVSLQRGWYKGFQKFGNDWDVCMTPIINLDGQRFRDWASWDDPDYGRRWVCREPWCPEGRVFNGTWSLVPYFYNKTHLMFVSGTYWVAKKDFMLKYPFNEELSWGQGEDVEWSLRWRDTSKYVLNQYSSVKLLKQKS